MIVVELITTVTTTAPTCVSWTADGTCKCCDLSIETAVLGDLQHLIAIYNGDTVSHTIKVYKRLTEDRKFGIVRMILAADESLHWGKEVGWHAIDANGDRRMKEVV